MSGAHAAGARLLRGVVWRRQGHVSLEHCRLWRGADSYRLEGRALLVLDGAPVEAAYSVECSSSWETRATRVRVERGEETRALELRRDDEGRWWTDGGPRTELDGIVDVDIGFTPSTNTLPIRRLALEVGSAADVRAAWIRFPELTVEVLDQRYVRTGPAAYRYESRGGSFTAHLTMDEHDVVVDYGDVWTRVAAV